MTVVTERGVRARTERVSLAGAGRGDRDRGRRARLQALDAAQDGSAETGHLGEALLGQTLLDTSFPECSANGFDGLALLVRLHA